MRSAIFLLVVIIAGGIGAAGWDGTSPPRDAQALDWVRTADGWTRPDALFPSTRRAPQLHPFVVAGFQALASTLALALAPSGNHKRAPSL